MQLVIHPARKRPGFYSAVVAGRTLVGRSRQPVYDAALQLLEEGVDPETVIEARHAVAITPFVTSTIRTGTSDP